MKTRDSKPNKECKRVENLLIQKSPDGFLQPEREVIEKHLDGCGSCRVFRERVMSFYDSLAVPANSHLKPNPEIRKLAKNRLKQVRPSAHGSFHMIKTFLHNFIKFKIPVYQAALGMAVCLFIILFLNRHHVSKQSRMMGQIESYRNYGHADDVLEHIDLFHSQKIGRNIVEDSLLFRILVVPEYKHTYQKNDTVSSQLL